MVLRHYGSQFKIPVPGRDDRSFHRAELSNGAHKADVGSRVCSGNSTSCLGNFFGGKLLTRQLHSHLRVTMCPCHPAQEDQEIEIVVRWGASMLFS